MTRMAPEEASPSPNFCTIPANGRLILHFRFKVHQAPIHSRSFVGTVSNLEPSVPADETLPPWHHRAEPLLKKQCSIAV
ncbi:hypothetical protein AVEN_237425-1 [Araneus ventricosus]|uniref:Uncharacterized protein n=1 Tax=Araneus ventricosus TaxID=182803 RepID=A0A4Y2KKX0_ARAVE|nr:hypothetical protein AVEN_237425-1 [Araneus ventricosus]